MKFLQWRKIRVCRDATSGRGGWAEGRVFLSRERGSAGARCSPSALAPSGVLVDQPESRFFYLPNRESRDEEKEKAKAQT